MTSLKNRVQLLGNLGQDPEVVKFDNGKMKANIRLATSDSFRSKNGDTKEDTQWHNVIAWNGLATIAEKFLKKGSEIAVEGRLKYRDFDDKEGNKKYVTEVVINDLVMLRRSKQN